ncbi:MAG: hypothetical protein PHG65_04630 [Kiritimatiellae bacterium]|nr:hypothetical protein [Kiritimatiellia bacterium]
MKRGLRYLVYGMGVAAMLCATQARAGEDYERIITRAYEDILNRKPDTGGLRNYRIKMIDEGWSEQDVRNDLRNSTEAKKGDVDQIIRRAYQDLLGRDPDRAGFDNYRKMIRDKDWSEQDVRNSIRESQEYRNKH